MGRNMGVSLEPKFELNLEAAQAQTLKFPEFRQGRTDELVRNRNGPTADGICRRDFTRGLQQRRTTGDDKERSEQSPTKLREHKNPFATSSGVAVRQNLAAGPNGARGWRE